MSAAFSLHVDYGIPGSGVIHVWCVNLAGEDLQRSGLSAVLSPDEIERAARYRSSVSRKHFVACRVALRCILGHYLDMDPGALRFAVDANHKPYLAGQASSLPRLDFNVSHSHGLALCAFMSDGCIGVDVEYVLRDVDREAIARRFFSQSECVALQSAPPAQRRDLFFQYWTCKEAYVKATGKGLSGLQDADLQLEDCQPVGLKSPSGMRLYAFSPETGYQAAVVAKGCDHVLQIMDYACEDP